MYGSAYRYPLTASDMLNEMVRWDAFRNRVDEWFDGMDKGPGTIYAKDTYNYGPAEAERRQRERANERGYNAFADSVGSAAAGILELARLDDRRLKAATDELPKPLVRIVPIKDNSPLPGTYRYRNGVIILAENPSVPGCGCSQPQGSTQFGRGGEIGLQSVGIMTNSDMTDPQLLLILPHPQYRALSSEVTRYGFAAIAIDTQGHDSGTVVDYYLYNNTVEYALGLVEPKDLIGGSQMSSGINAALDFPGSREYLQQHLPHLGGYLKNAAAKLTGEHSH